MSPPPPWALCVPSHLSVPPLPGHPAVSPLPGHTPGCWHTRSGPGLPVVPTTPTLDPPVPPEPSETPPTPVPVPGRGSGEALSGSLPSHSHPAPLFPALPHCGTAPLAGGAAAPSPRLLLPCLPPLPPTPADPPSLPGLSLPFVVAPAEPGGGTGGCGNAGDTPDSSHRECGGSFPLPIGWGGDAGTGGFSSPPSPHGATLGSLHPSTPRAAPVCPSE